VPGHRGHRPADGQSLEVPPRRQITFRPADGLRAAIRERPR
jgi:nucleoid DNA-binding protein